MTAILIIDDESQVRKLLAEYLQPLEYTLMAADSLTEGLSIIEWGQPDLVLLDVNLPDGNGIDAIPAIRSAAGTPEVIIITAEGDAQGAKSAIENDAWDYILKPFTKHEIILNVKRALEFRSYKLAKSTSTERVFDRSSIIGTSPKLTACLDLTAQCAQTSANILITGPTGTGKEMFANIIHSNSPRNEHNMIVVDCAALPEQLVESVLFGSVKGAYTSADANRDGLVKKADGGTLFLDEIGEMPLNVQKKFLRVLQERRFKPVGGSTELKSNFRLICATNRNLEEMVKSGEFRSDLLFRIMTIHIDLPPLCDCSEDIKPLTLHYIHTLCEHHGLETKGFGPDFLQCLESYPWPGNVRELISCLEKAILANPESDMLFPNFLPQNIRLSSIRASIANHPRGSSARQSSVAPDGTFSIHLPADLLDPLQSLKQLKTYTISETEKMYLRHLMTLTNGDMETASTLAGISKSRLYSLLKSHRVSNNGQINS